MKLPAALLRIKPLTAPCHSLHGLILCFSIFVSVFCGTFWTWACSSEEAKTKIPHKVSASLAQALEKLDLSKKAEKEKLGQSEQRSHCHSSVLERSPDLDTVKIRNPFKRVRAQNLYLN